jgi:glycosidase
VAYDVDGFRIDTLKHGEPDFARVFGNAIREYALSIGKRNFFTFGEVADAGDEALLAEFIGRDTLSSATDEAIGVDAALDSLAWAAMTPSCSSWTALSVGRPLTSVRVALAPMEIQIIAA